MGELSAVLGRPATVQDVKSVTEAQAEAVYRSRYWDAINGDGLPAGVDLMMLDFGINAGPSTSAMALQRLIGVRQDGNIGRITLRALGTHQADWLLEGLRLAHMSYYKNLACFVQFGNGWMARNDRAVAAARAMIQPQGATPVVAANENRLPQ